MSEDRATYQTGIQPEQASDKPKYDTCKNCGAEAVHLATSAGIVFFGNETDRDSNESVYGEREISPEVVAGCHVCFECEEVEDVWIEIPHQGDDTFILNWLKDQWSQRLGIGPAHKLACRVHLGEDIREVAKELMRTKKEDSR